MANGEHPYGDIESFEVKVQDRKLYGDSPVTTAVMLALTPEAGSPTLLIGLWLPEAKDKAEAERQYQRAKEIEALLDDYVTGVSFQVLK